MSYSPMRHFLLDLGLPPLELLHVLQEFGTCIVDAVREPSMTK